MTASTPPAPRWSRLSEAIAFALDLHAEQTRKGSQTPYISHLLAVAGIVLEHGGDQDHAIAATLHDAIEDQGAHQEPIIAGRFGPRVAHIVRACTDADTVPKPPWEARKQAYIAHLAHADPDVWLVSMADKLHNARSICADLRTHGNAMFDRFRGGQEGTLWYYRALARQFGELMPGPLWNDLADAVRLMHELAQAGLAPGELYERPDPTPDSEDQRRLSFADEAERLHEPRIIELVAEIKHLATSAPALAPHGDLLTANFWNEYAVAVAEDAMMWRDIYDRQMQHLCVQVLDRLSDFECQLLCRTTERYLAVWCPEEADPDEKQTRRWLVDSLMQVLTTDALNHGEDLKEGVYDEVDDTSLDEQEEA